MAGFTGPSIRILTGYPLATSACFLAGAGGRLQNTATALQQLFVSNTSDGTYWVAGLTKEATNKIAYISCLRGTAPFCGTTVALPFRMTNRRTDRELGVWALASVALLSACGELDPTDFAGEEPQTVVSQPLSIYATGVVAGFTGPSIEILTHKPLATSACFLAGAGGRLQNTATAQQQLFVSDTSDGKYWVAGLTTETVSKVAYYNCIEGIRRSQYTTHYWTSRARDPAPVDMGPANDRVCFLNRIDGWYNGNGEQVRTRISNGRWLLDGTWGTAHPYAVAAGATCILGVTTAERSIEYALTSPAGGLWLLDTPYDALWDDRNKHICGLTRLQGKFDGNSWIDDLVLVRFDQWNPKWYMHAHGNASPVSMGARCVVRDAL